MKKIKVYWAIMQELLLAPLAYLVGARAYVLNVRFADSNVFEPFTDVLFNKNVEEITVTKALDKFDELEKTLYSAMSPQETELAPISYISYLRNHVSEMLMWA